MIKLQQVEYYCPVATGGSVMLSAFLNVW